MWSGSAARKGRAGRLPPASKPRSARSISAPAATRRPMARRSGVLVRIDGHPVRGQIALAEHVALTWLTPQMDRLFIEGAGGGAGSSTVWCSASTRPMPDALSRYEHALAERGRLLRDGRGDDAWLSALEDEMATSGVAVAAARRDMVARLQQACEQAIGPFPRADLAVTGTVEDWLDEQPAWRPRTIAPPSGRSPPIRQPWLRLGQVGEGGGPSVLTAATCRSATGPRTCRPRSARPANRKRC